MPLADVWFVWGEQIVLGRADCSVEDEGSDVLTAWGCNNFVDCVGVEDVSDVEGFGDVEGIVDVEGFGDVEGIVDVEGFGDGEDIVDVEGFCDVEGGSDGQRWGESSLIVDNM